MRRHVSLVVGAGVLGGALLNPRFLVRGQLALHFFDDERKAGLGIGLDGQGAAFPRRRFRLRRLCHRPPRRCPPKPMSTVSRGAAIFASAGPVMEACAPPVSRPSV